MQQEFRNALGLRLTGVIRDRLGVKIGGIYVETRARVHEVANNKADEQCGSGNNLEVEQRLATHAANFFHVLHAGDAGDHRAKNDQRNDHGDEANETISERLHGDGFGGTQTAERYRENNGDEDLDPQICVERLFRNGLGGGIKEAQRRWGVGNLLVRRRHSFDFCAGLDHVDDSLTWRRFVFAGRRERTFNGYIMRSRDH